MFFEYWEIEVTLILTVFLICMLIFALKAKTHKADGRMVINLTDPYKDIYKIELDIPLCELTSKKQLHLDIVTEHPDAKNTTHLMK